MLWHSIDLFSGILLWKLKKILFHNEKSHYIIKYILKHAVQIKRHKTSFYQSVLIDVPKKNILKLN